MKILISTIILGFAFLAFQVTSPGGFVSDDYNILYPILSNPETFLHKIFIPDASWGFYRPIGSLYWFSLYKIFGAEPFYYWIASIINHGFNGILLFFILRRMGFDYFAALASGLIFVAFPLHGEAVAWMACAYERLCLFFILAGIYLHLRYLDGAGKTAYALSVVSFIFAILSKEMAITFPALVFLADLLRRKEGLSGIKGSALRALPSAIIAVAYIIVRIAVFNGIGGYSAGGGSLHSTFNAEVVINNILSVPGLLLFPINILLMPNPSSMILLLSFLFLISIIGAIFLGGTDIRYILSGFLWILIAYLPAITLYLAFPDLMGGRFSYIPSIGFAVLAGSLFGSPVTAGTWRRIIKAAPLAALLGCYIYISNTNYASWAAAYRIAETIPQQVRKMAPNPPPGSKMYFIGKYNNIAGAYIYRNGLGDAINLAYGRKGEGNIHVKFIGSDGRVLGNPSLTVDILENSDKDNYIFAFDNVRNKVLPVYLPKISSGDGREVKG